MRARSPILALLALLLTLALVATACGDDGDATPSDTTTTAADTAPPSEETPDPEVETPVDETPEEAAPTATDTGVTAEVIRLGVVFPDTALIGRDPGDIDAKFQTIADAINDAGGINGRMLELHIRTPNPLDDVGYDELCVEFAEDLEVFAAIGLFARTTSDCLPTLHDTIVVNTFPIADTSRENYTAPGISVVGRTTRLVDARVAALIDGGILAEGMQVALSGAAAAERAMDLYRDALEAAGVGIATETIINADGTDLVALESELGVAAEVWNSSGAEAVVSTTAAGAQALLIAYNQSNISIPMILPEGTGVSPSLLQNQLGLDLAPFDFAVALVEGNDQATKYANDEDGVKECVDNFEAASGEEVALDESRNNLGVTVVACQVFDIFVPIAEAAGINLTTESFAAAADTFGEIEVTDLAEASIGADKYDLGDAVGTPGRFNPETVQFEPIG